MAALRVTYSQRPNQRLSYKLVDEQLLLVWLCQIDNQNRVNDSTPQFNMEWESHLNLFLLNGGNDSSFLRVVVKFDRWQMAAMGSPFISGLKVVLTSLFRHLVHKQGCHSWRSLGHSRIPLREN